MPSTSVHLPKGLLESLDHLATEKGLSRNRVIVDACERAVESGRGDWPAGYLSGAHLRPGESRALRRGFEEWQRAIQAARRSRRRPPF